MEDSRGDAELLRALRGGDQAAYAVLWERHIGAALRYAHRLFPSRSEDLASEALLAIYQQVTTSDAGPEFAFRSYLKAVIRNTAIRWRKDADHIDDTVEPDRADFRDALSLVERETNAQQFLGAFQELPERWQRVLWLTEVADVPRPEVARELGIKPNAVSALQRRARSGLKLQWLTSQVPLALRDDEAHVARLLPRHLTEPLDEAVAQEVAGHVSSCDVCGELLIGLRSDAQRLHGVTLSAVGFGALGVILPSTGAFAPGTAVAAAVIVTGAGAGLASLLAGGLGVLTAGTLILGSFLLPGAAPAASTPAAEGDKTWSVARSVPEAGAPAHVVGAPDGTVATPAPSASPSPPRTGRWNSDPSIDSIDLVNDPDAPGPLNPTRPETAPGTTPDPGETPGSALGPGVTSPTASSGYLAPVVAGTATPGSAVAIEVDGARYTPAVAADGAWSFDPRTLQLAAGTYDYRAWAFDAVGQSPATTGTFTIIPIVIEGFENISGTEDMQVEEARTTGVVIAATGPANGSIYVTTMQGHSAIIPLDGTGRAVKRLRMNSRGWYWFTFRAMDAEGYIGPIDEHPLDVYDPDIIFDPWGPGPEEMTFELVDP
ncbi:sigma-70 family RNA polymerase sigma factor [Microbacterium sp.]|uniref:sigma-70 family RNA polymerase sigma factor n=1 Tax=Microbacterium sp. TaxID=51671 RepID=UPI0026072BF7|nr:sigma-70 family RNA polymerase sigma factor [Microbacterium sp.]